MGRSRSFFFTIFFGVFAVMALSNALIPILPELDTNLGVQTIIFSAYFFGAMVTTFPAGMMSDRFGQVSVIFSGLFLTTISGFSLLFFTGSVSLIMIRFIEGVGAGLFIAASLSWINYQRNHTRLSSFYMAILNLGLLTGLVFGGWISGFFHNLSSGVFIFTILSVFPLIGILMSVANSGNVQIDIIRTGNIPLGLIELLHDAGGMSLRQAPLWYSVIILLGITGFVQALFPELSDLPASEIGIALACMNLATIIAALIAPRFQVEPVLLIRISSILMGVLVLVFIRYPVSIFIMGGVAGLIMISQMNYLAVAEEHQGIAMGIFSTSNYAGMTLIPAIGGYVAGLLSINHAAIMISILAFICVFTIGWCRCRGFRIPP